MTRPCSKSFCQIDLVCVFILQGGKRLKLAFVIAPQMNFSSFLDRQLYNSSINHPDEVLTHLYIRKLYLKCCHLVWHLISVIISVTFISTRTTPDQAVLCGINQPTKLKVALICRLTLSPNSQSDGSNLASGL